MADKFFEHERHRYDGVTWRTAMAADTAAVVFGGRASSKVNVGQGLVGGIGISSMLRTDLTLVSHRSLRCEDNSNRWLQGLQLLVNEGQAR